MAFNPSLLALTPNTLNLNVHKFQIYAFKIIGFLNCSPGAAVKKIIIIGCPLHCLCVYSVCVCVCVCVHYCVCTWVGERLSTNSEYGLSDLATRHAIMPKDTHDAKLFSPIKWLSRMPRPRIK